MSYLRDRHAYAEAAAGPAWVRRLGAAKGIGPAATRMWRAYYQHQLTRRWHNANHASAQALREQPPALDAVQRRVVDDLVADGIATAPISAFLPPGLWTTLQAEVEAWLRSPDIVDAEAAYEQGTLRQSKPWRLDMFGRGADVSRESPWLRAGLELRILDTVNAYLGVFSRMQFLDVWKSFPVPEAEPDHPAQEWHRDNEDRKLVCTFLYFTDVDATNGGIRYIPSSRPGEKWGSLWPQEFPVGATAPADELEKIVPASAIRSGGGPVGTLVFVDTAGIHRGGRARSRSRVVSTWTYVTPASVWPRTFAIRHAVPEQTYTLPPCVRYALDGGPDGDWVDTVLMPARAARAAERTEGLKVKEAARMEHTRHKQEIRTAKLDRTREKLDIRSAKLERTRRKLEKRAAKLERERRKQEKRAAELERAAAQTPEAGQPAA